LAALSLEEAAGSIIEVAREMQRCGHSFDFAGWRERRTDRMRRLTNPEQREAILGDEFVEARLLVVAQQAVSPKLRQGQEF